MDFPSSVGQGLDTDTTLSLTNSGTFNQLQKMMEASTIRIWMLNNTKSNNEVLKLCFWEIYES